MPNRKCKFTVEVRSKDTFWVTARAQSSRDSVALGNRLEESDWTPDKVNFTSLNSIISPDPRGGGSNRTKGTTQEFYFDSVSGRSH